MSHSVAEGTAPSVRITLADWLNQPAPLPLPERPAQEPLPWFEELMRCLGSAYVGKKWQCPLHGATGDHAVSLSLGRADDGRLLIHCHGDTRCKCADILRVLGVTRDALRLAPATPPAKHARMCLRGFKFPPARNGGSPQSQGFRFEAEHPYGHLEDLSRVEAWKIRLRHPVSGEKRVSWESLNIRGERVPGLFGRKQADFPLYHEGDVKKAVALEEPVILVESESSVDALVKVGFYATTWAGSASDPPVARLADVLGGYAHLVIIPDNDSAGLACLEKLKPLGGRVLMGESGEDARDLLKRLGAKAFLKLVNSS